MTFFIQNDSSGFCIEFHAQKVYILHIVLFKVS